MERIEERYKMSRKYTEEDLKRINCELERERKAQESLKRALPKRNKNNCNEVYEKWDFLREYWKSGWNKYKFPFKNLEHSEKDFFQKYICSYPVPDFLMLNSPQMIATIVSGKSFYKQWKLLFTKKEAHEFLNLKAPYIGYLNYSNEDINIAQAIIFAKTIARGFDPKTCYFIMGISQKWYISILESGCIKTLEVKAVKIIEFTNRFLDFLVNHKDYQWDRDDWECMLDFLSNTVLYGNHDFNFSNRTPESLLKLTNEWHKQQEKLKGKDGCEKWDGLRHPDKTYTLQDQSVWAITQIKDSKTLQIEGSKMHHCVYSYLPKCLRGDAGIYKVEHIDVFGSYKKEATIEISRYKTIVQAKGVSNSQLSNSCKSILKRYCQETGLSIDCYM
jgi:hypothetical protein